MWIIVSRICYLDNCPWISVRGKSEKLWLAYCNRKFVSTISRTSYLYFDIYKLVSYQEVFVRIRRLEKVYL